MLSIGHVLDIDYIMTSIQLLQCGAPYFPLYDCLSLQTL